MVKAASGLPEHFVSILKDLSPFTVALSGGVDSRFLCQAAIMTGCDVRAIHARGPHIPENESDYARKWAEDISLPYTEIDFNPLSLEDVRDNSRNRCYACKKSLLKKIGNHTEAGRIICDGGQLDDNKAYRPGMKAVAEAGIVSPLALAKFNKGDIRRLARAIGLANPSQKARPCLLTRYAYGLKPGFQQLEKLAKAETLIASFFAGNGQDAIDFRLRLLPQPVLHLTALDNSWLPDLQAILQDNGFESAQIEYQEKLSGYFDRN